MKNRNRIIIALALVAVALLAAVELVYLPQQRQAQENYRMAQQEPVTHDLAAILPYQSKYMGDAPNNINLFHALPLNQYLNGFEQNPALFELTVNYSKSTGEVGTQKLEKAVIYNSTAAFALIGNLQVLKYHFNDQTYTVTRSGVQGAVAENPAGLLTKSVWKTNLQDKLQDDGYVQKTFQKIAQ